MTRLTALMDSISAKTSTLYGMEYEIGSWWDEVMKSVNELHRGGWTGKGADAFFAHMKGPMDKQIKDTIQNVMILRKKLDEAGKMVEAADEMVAPVNVIEEVIDAIGNWF